MLDRCSLHKAQVVFRSWMTRLNERIVLVSSVHGLGSLSLCSASSEARANSSASQCVQSDSQQGEIERGGRIMSKNGYKQLKWRNGIHNGFLLVC